MENTRAAQDKRAEQKHRTLDASTFALATGAASLTQLPGDAPPPKRGRGRPRSLLTKKEREHARQLAARAGVDVETPEKIVPSLEIALGRDINNEYSVEIEKNTEEWRGEKSSRPLLWTPEMHEAALRMAAGQGRVDVARAVGMRLGWLVELEENLEFQVERRRLVKKHGLCVSADVALGQAQIAVALQAEAVRRAESGDFSDLETKDLLTQLGRAQNARLRTIEHETKQALATGKMTAGGGAVHGDDNRVINVVVGQINNLPESGRAALREKQDDLLALAGIADTDVIDVPPDGGNGNGDKS